MKEKNKLGNKVKRLLRKAGMPRFLHHFGPKTFELWQHIFALFFKTECRLSYRRTVKLLKNLGFVVATKSTIQRYATKLDLPFWQMLLNKTIPSVLNLAAIDGTCLERTNASWHYIKRINGKPPRLGYKLSILSSKKKIICMRLRAKPAHDIMDAKYILSKAKLKPEILLMDKGYDAEWLHKHCHRRGINSIAPVRKGIRSGFHRKRLFANFPQKLYNKRSSIVESMFHAIKQKFGASVSSKLIGPARTEVYCRAILHNVFLRMLETWDKGPFLQRYKY
jgi:transposase